jgi:Zn-dependent M28 family amino/carboxypeptidase
VSKYDKQEPPKVTYPAQLQSELIALRDAALADDYAYQQVAHLTENIGPRPTGSLQAEAAVNYVADEMRKLGLDVRLEEVKVKHWIRGAETAELVEYPGQVPGTTQKIVITALGGNIPTPSAGITAPVVVVNNFDELKTLGRDKVAGHVVLFNVHFDHGKAIAGSAFDAYDEAVAYRVKGGKEAAALGAIASLVRSVGDADYRVPHTGYSTAVGIPQGAVTSEDANLITHLVSQGTVRIHMVLTSETGPEVISHNVVADLKGSERPEDIVIVSGHLDSWDLGTGAIDDGAGVAVAMETAELLHKLHLQPKRTIRVIAWMDEEKGGRGHDAYPIAHQAELAQHVAAIESDSGAEHPLGFRAKITAAAKAQLAPVQDILSVFGANLLQLTEDSPETDIEPLAKKGVPALGIWQNGLKYFEYHHTPADTLDKIVPQELRENATAMAVMAYAIANMPQRLPR